eukprot:m.152980 g.152980  ORF g.152980 m.152980 type:complete len:85 (+) comp17453_c0_seq1:172-426(+)
MADSRHGLKALQVDAATVFAEERQGLVEEVTKLLLELSGRVDEVAGNLADVLDSGLDVEEFTAAWSKFRHSLEATLAQQQQQQQ